MDGLRAGFAAGDRSQMLYLPTGGGKCLGKGTHVVMSNGSIIRVEEIRPNDLLLGADGRILKVKSTMIGRGVLYRVTPTKGDAYIVNGDHILSLKLTGNKCNVIANGISYSPGEVCNITVDDWLLTTKTFRHCAKSWRPECIEFHNTIIPLSIPPYILGAWLGDGSLHAPAITGIDREIISAWTEYAINIGLHISVDDGNGTRCPTYHIRGDMCGGRNTNNLTDSLKKLKLFKLSKFIPSEYKTSSATDRLALLAGIVDTDGSYAHGFYDITLKSETLINDIAFVARSLGFYAFVRHYKKEATNGLSGKQTYYRISICGDIKQIPCKVLRKIAVSRKQKKNVLLSGVNIDPIGEGEYYGFEVEGDYKLFLLGDFQVTHNTEIAIEMLSAAAEKGNRVAMVLDRRILCEQTSARLEKYGIDHGVLMAGHWRYRPEKMIQICSAQTLEAKGDFPAVKLLIIDEAHCLRDSVREFIQNRPDVKVVGLSASPFTKGLGTAFSGVVSKSTTRELVDLGMLSPMRVFLAKEIDMEGAKKVAGEWSQKEATTRGVRITGDVVSEWVKKTHEIYGGPRKTIVFCAGVAHGIDLQRAFAEAGYNFQCLSYKDEDEFKSDVIADFGKPDTDIHGLIATDILTKGFDNAEVCIGISARPFTKSFSSHVQQMGRVMRPHHDKEHCTWICHSGNFLRFRDDWERLYSEGVSELDDGAEKPKQEPKKEEKEAAKCHKCGALWPGNSDICAHCGAVRVRRNDVITVPGEVLELTPSEGKKEEFDSSYKKGWYQAMLHHLAAAGKNPNRAYHLYKEKFGVYPTWEKKAVPNPRYNVAGYVNRANIAFAKRKASA